MSSPEPTLSPQETAIEVRFAMRNIMYPTIPILLFVALAAFVVLLKRDEDGVGAKVEKFLLGVAAFQAVLAVLCLFAFDDGVVFMQFLFAALVGVFYALQPERTLVGQFVSIASVVNFFCVLGLFPLLGWRTFVIDAVVNTGLCTGYFGFEPDPLDPLFVSPQCTAYLNVVAFAAIMLACLQPFSALFAYLLFSHHDVLSK